MAKFTDYFKVISPQPNTTAMTDSQSIGDQGVYANYTWYQRLVQGSASRLTRYREYDLMDNDVEVARALDTIAEEMTGSNPETDLPLELLIQAEKEEHIPTSVATTLRTALRYWADIHEWDIRLYNLCRVMVKYGDCFFRRRGELERWEFLHPKHVVAAIVDERDMTKVVGWQVKKDIKEPTSPYTSQIGGYGSAQQSENTEIIPASDLIWFTRNDDMGEAAPFGESLLRCVYRAQKQKELLEDAIIIYRITRAPERRVFYIDVGKMPPQRVKGYLEQFKNELRQRRVPSFQGGKNEIDSVYNPTTMNEDYFFAQRPDGRGSKVDTLPGGAGLGELADLEYFQAKVWRGMRVPLSYMFESKGEQGAIFSGGKLGMAYIQELRFALFVNRQQSYVERVLDAEFKRFLRASNINIDPAIYKIKLQEAENFGTYRQQELDSALLGAFGQAQSVPFFSPRFSMSRFLQLTDEEILKNERMKREELGLDPDGGAEDYPKIYGTPGAEGGLGGGLGGGIGGGMMPGTLGAGMGFGEEGMPPAEGQPEMGGMPGGPGAPAGEMGVPAGGAGAVGT